MLSLAGEAGSIHVADIREESPTPSGSLPIVFVHGMVGHSEFWNSALAACADRRRAVAMDLRGHGRSDPAATGDYAVERCADDVIAVMNALGIDAAIVVGHSYGAIVATETAARRPDIVRRLVLADPPGDFTRVAPDVRDSQIVPFLATLDTDTWRGAVQTSFEDALQGSTDASKETIRGRLAAMPRETMRSMYHSMFAYPAADAVTRYLAHPGREAYAILAPPNAWPFSLHVLVPAIHSAVIPHVGHWLMLDAPDRFVAELANATKGL